MNPKSAKVQTLGELRMLIVGWAFVLVVTLYIVARGESDTG